MESFYDRTELQIGSLGVEKLKKARIAIFGVGGVGGFAFECLVRSGIKNITVFDGDTIKPSNLNRQVIATTENLGKDKVEVAVLRAYSINKDGNFKGEKVFYTKQNADEYPLENFDYIIDAIDTVSSKIALILRAKEKGVKIISSMGTGGKLDPTLLQVTDINKTEYCPLARVMRRELKKRGVLDLKVVYSKEQAIKENRETTKTIPSMMPVPSVAGILLATEVIKDILG
jgi:tRNA A37 threonylcarbamoyladenosine dehydratase